MLFGNCSSWKQFSEKCHICIYLVMNGWDICFADFMSEISLCTEAKARFKLSKTCFVCFAFAKVSGLLVYALVCLMMLSVRSVNTCVCKDLLQ